MQRLRVNLEAIDGEALMFTVTGPPWASGDFDVWQWNVTVWDRWPELRRYAREYAHRAVPGQQVGLVAWVPEPQQRGAIHFHLVFEAHSAFEKRWAEAYCRYLRQNVQRFGFGRVVKKGEWGPAAGLGYVAKGLAGYLAKGGDLLKLWEDGDLPGRCVYVARRLTDRTGCTIAMLRRRSQVWHEGLSVALACLDPWRRYEKALRRRLSRRELLCLAGVQERGSLALERGTGVRRC